MLPKKMPSQVEKNLSAPQTQAIKTRCPFVNRKKWDTPTSRCWLLTTYRRLQFFLAIRRAILLCSKFQSWNSPTMKGKWNKLRNWQLSRN